MRTTQKQKKLPTPEEIVNLLNSVKRKDLHEMAVIFFGGKVLDTEEELTSEQKLQHITNILKNTDSAITRKTMQIIEEAMDENNVVTRENTKYFLAGILFVYKIATNRALEQTIKKIVDALGEEDNKS